MEKSYHDRLELHTSMLASHEARLKSVEEQVNRTNAKLDKMIWLMVAIITEIPFTVMI